MPPMLIRYGIGNPHPPRLQRIQRGVATPHTSKPASIWKCINDFVFNRLLQPSHSVAQRGLTWARYYNDATHPSPTRQLRHASSGGWPRPRSGWICINVDGAVHLNTSMGSIGGLIRDSEGSWIMGFNRSLGLTSIFNAEL
ncbi:hypothetical protein V6N11_053869 [Hibiscus sabdariffa]|uniref:RNase H type-1 domain-containing protein n=1 Tax=Hibiscus sabdariffa TaxID=183260 RepID=A0ABR2S328_9ROSI